MENDVLMFYKSLASVAVMSLLGALMLSLAVQWVQKLRVPFWKAYSTVFLASAVNLLFGFIVTWTVGAHVRFQDGAIGLVLITLPIGFFIQSVIVWAVIAIPFGRACLVSLAMIGVGLGFGSIVLLLASLLETFFRA